MYKYVENLIWKNRQETSKLNLIWETKWFFFCHPQRAFYHNINSWCTLKDMKMCGFRYIRNLTSYYALHGVGNVFYVFCPVNFRIWVTELGDSGDLSFNRFCTIPTPALFEYYFHFMPCMNWICSTYKCKHYCIRIFKYFIKINTNWFMIKIMFQLILIVELQTNQSSFWIFNKFIHE